MRQLLLPRTVLVMLKGKKNLIEVSKLVNVFHLMTIFNKGTEKCPLFHVKSAVHHRADIK